MDVVPEPNQVLGERSELKHYRFGHDYGRPSSCPLRNEYREVNVNGSIARCGFARRQLTSQRFVIGFRDGQIEFLLVKTRAGRWTFPKGRVEDDATRSAAAAREAFEEAGVHGQVDPLPFATYLHSKAPHIRASNAEFQVDAHLCEEASRAW